MADAGRDELREEIAGWVSEYSRDRGALLPVLQRIQRKYQMISDAAMQHVADAFGVHPVEIHAVVSFYSFLDWTPKGRFIVRLCQTVSCEMQGKAAVAAALEKALGISFGETTPDGLFTLEYANCLGLCDQGPAMLVNDEVFASLTPDKAAEVIAGCRNAAANAAAAV